MLIELKRRFRDQRRRRLVHRATWHLDARTLRDIGLEPMPKPKCDLYAPGLHAFSR